MKKQRTHYTPEEKVTILRRHLLEKEPISELCDKAGLQPTSSTAGRRSSLRMARQPSSRRGQPTIPQIKSGSPTWKRSSKPKDEVLAELMAEHVALKKTLGEL
jgi:transposase